MCYIFFVFFLKTANSSLRIKDQSLSGLQSSTPTINALVSRLNVTFCKKSDTNDPTNAGQEENDTRSNASETWSEKSKDLEPDVERAAVSVTFSCDGSRSAEYITDPADDPFAPKTKLG